MTMNANSPKAVLARPNIKAFFLGALLVALVQHFVADCLPHPGPLAHRGAPPLDSSLAPEVQQLLQEVGRRPTSEGYVRLSHEFEKRRNYRQALAYLRRAEAFAEWEDQ